MEETGGEGTNYSDIAFMTRAGSSISSSATLTTTSTPSSSPVYSGNFSLAEHSYCASLTPLVNPHSPDPDGGGAECGVSDSADNTDSLIPRGGFSMEFGAEDVNFDGFNFAIPLHESVGRGESMEGLQWRSECPAAGGGGLCGDLNTGEVTSSCSVTVPGNGDRDADQGQQPRQVNVGKDKRTGRGAKAILRKYSRPRRRDYIENQGEREQYFEHVLKKLTLQLRRVCCRTGCEGELSAVFDGKVFNASPTLTCNDPLGGPVAPCVVSSNANLHVSNSCTTSSTVNRLEVDDHRYAATMTAQNVKFSSEVWDHQYSYDGKSGAPNREWDVDCADRDVSGSKDIETDQPKKRAERLDFIKQEGAREQTFCKFANSLFSQKKTLEQRTGANVYLILTYGRCIINGKNYQDCARVIASGKKVPTQRVVQQLAPKPGEQESVPLTFILPGCLPIRVPVTISGSEMISRSPTPVYQIVTPSHSSDNIMLPVYSAVPEIELPNVLGTETDDPVSGQDAVGFEVSRSLPFLELNPTGSYSTIDTNAYNQGSPPQQSVTTSSSVAGVVDMQESSTNTEPICSVCQNRIMNSNNSSGTCSKVKSLFWIRCNDPFCYDMVHASCVGFMVTHAAHLRHLPPFYCKIHR